MNPGLAASVAFLLGLSALAGWLSAFRNRAYLGWLGLTFVAVGGFALAYGRAQNAQSLGLPAHGAVVAERALLVLALLTFLLAMATAVRETVRRVREIRDGQRAAEEALLAMMQANRERERGAEQEDASGPGSEKG